MQIQRSYLYAAGGLLLAAAISAGLVVWSEKRKVSPDAAPPQQGFAKPRGLAFGADGSLFIADSRNNRIVRQRPGGDKYMGKQGIRDGEFREPCDIKVGRDGNLYVADTFYTIDPNGMLPWGRIQKLTPEGSFIASWSKSSNPPADFFGPRGIAVDSKNFVYLSDTGNHRILKFDLNGAFIASWGGKGSRAGQFEEPFGMDFDAKDQLYVVDRLNFRVQVFNDEGSYIREFKIEAGDKEQVNREPYIAIDADRGYAWITDPAKGRVLRYGLTGGMQKAYDTGLEGKLKQPTGVAVRKSDGVIFLSDGETGKIMSVKP